MLLNMQGKWRSVVLEHIVYLNFITNFLAPNDLPVVLEHIVYLNK